MPASHTFQPPGVPSFGGPDPVPISIDLPIPTFDAMAVVQVRHAPARGDMPSIDDEPVANLAATLGFEPAASTLEDAPVMRISAPGGASQ